jgi:hypothetical protein
MIWSNCKLVRALLIFSTALALLVSGCHKKPVTASTPPPPTPVATKPSASLAADRTSVNKGESVKLSVHVHHLYPQRQRSGRER